MMFLLMGLVFVCNRGSLNAEDSSPGFNRLTTEDTVGNVLNHPAFAGFARLLLPWDSRA